ncbi:aldo/keto reductase [Sphingobacterium sp. DR205]|uniref:aldo/keto reductase n=1 Tax=Sphingobacterium sp. DR205 TaxID=2713573 RepID=UPI0013E4DED0|nr:aldo/keto reductase [Sphingobacterium sp. DR205]QIH31563.1 aldo/keto reductase [Sphingobacterium sp. DR205]
MNITNKIGLGTVQFGMSYGISNNEGKTSELAVHNILSYAIENQIDLIDTAAAYGDSEEVLGKNDLSQFRIVSKFLLLDNNEKIEAQLDASLEKLQVQSIYGYMAHRPISIAKDPSIWKDLNSLKEKGKVKKIGFSFNDLEEVSLVLGAGFIPDIIQVPFNYLDNRFLPAMKDLKQLGCEIHTRSTFLQGLFFCCVEELDEYFSEAKPILTRLAKYGDKLPGLLLKYVLTNDLVDKVIIGVNNQKQLQQNIESVRLSIKEELDIFNERVSDNILTPSKWPIN